MPQYDFDEIILKTGIRKVKLEEEIKVMDALQELALILANEGHKYALYGGTAINKIYFNERQRLSYDLDIEAFSYEKTKALFERISDQGVPFSKAARFIYKGVQVDLTKATRMEEPRVYNAKSLLSFFNYPIASVNVPSYSLEYLMARKTVALLSRMVNKDIYDAWTGLELMTDTNKYKDYLYRFARADKIDVKYLIAQLGFFSERGFIVEENVKIDALKVVRPSIMVRDVLRNLEMLGVR
jgi:predicted nucleotidyltransferase component of viral defense system